MRKLDDTNEITVAELGTGIGTLLIGLAILCGIGFDWIGWKIQPWLILVLTCALVAALGLVAKRAIHIQSKPDDWLGWLLIVVVTTGYCIYPSLPDLVPPSHHYDAVNHVVLTTYIYEQNALPRGITPDTMPYFMGGYPAGGALFGALVSHWVGRAPIQTIHLVISFILGLCAGLIFVVTRRLLQDNRHRTAIAWIATMLLFTAWAYFPGTVNERYFYAQVFSQFFALGAFFFAVLYWESPNGLWLGLMTLCAATTIVTHPTGIAFGAAIVAGIIFFQSNLSWRNKLAHGLIYVSGLGIVGLIYALPRLRDWSALSGYGEAATFSIDNTGWLLPGLGLAGILFALLPRWRKTFAPVLLLGLASLAQLAFIFLAAQFAAMYLPYFIDRAIYLTVYPLAILAALPIVVFVEYIETILPKNDWRLGFNLLALVLCGVILFLNPARPFAPITADEIQAAEWAKNNVAKDDVAVVSAVKEDAYWIQWAILDNAPAQSISANAYFLGSMHYEEWRNNPSQPNYAIVRNLVRVSLDPDTQLVYQQNQVGVVRKSSPRAIPAPHPSTPTQYRIGDMFDLVGYDAQAVWQPDRAITLTLYWQPERWPTNRMSMFIQALDGQDQVIARSEKTMFQNQFPTQHWPIGTVVTDTWTIPLGAATSPGEYSLELAVFPESTGQRMTVTMPNTAPSDSVTLGPFRVAPTPVTQEELAQALPLDAKFDNGITLNRYALSSSDLRAGDTLQLTLYWSEIAPVKTDYKVFVHLLDANGVLHAQVDTQPQNGLRPTSQWQTDEMIADPYALKLPRDLAAGMYQIEIGLYDPANLQRVSVGARDHLILPTSILIR